MKISRNFKKVCLICFFAVLMTLSFAMVGLSLNTVETKAGDTLSPETFEMEEGSSAKLTTTPGIRFRVKMDAETKAKVEEGSATITFIVTPKVFVNSVADFKTASQKMIVVADKTLLYTEDAEEDIDEDSIWYANCVIANIKEANRKLDYSCVAYVTDGTTTVYTSNYAYNNLYATLNSAVYDETYREYLDRIIGEGLYNWFGTESYPVIVANQSQYDILQVNGANQEDNEDLYLAIPTGVTTADSEVEFMNLSTSYIVTFNDYDGNLLKKVAVPAGGTVSSLPTVTTSEENKMVDGYVYSNGLRTFTTSTVVNSDLTVTANLVSYYSDTTPYVYDKTNGNTYTMPVVLKSATATVNGTSVDVQVENKKLQLPAGLDLSTGAKTLKITGVDADGNSVRIAQSIEVVDEVDVYINSASDFNDWYVASNYSTKYNQGQYIVLNANIDLSSYTYGWMSGTERSNMNFNGTFNGQGYNIDNFNTYYGFVSLSAEGTVKNVSFTNVYHTNVQWGGGFFAKTILGTVSNVYYSGTFKAGTAGSTTGIMHQCHNAVNVENFVVVLKADETIITPELGYGIAVYAKDWSTMYIVDEIFNPTETTNEKIVNAGVTDNDKYNFYETLTSFKAEVPSLPNGFNSSLWTIDSTNGLIFKNALIGVVEEKNNNYFDTVYNSTNTSTESTGATYEADLSTELGLDVYSKEFSGSAMFVANYNNLVSKGYIGWSFAIMSTADTSLIYANAVKLEANTWYYIHIAVETADLTVDSVSYPDCTVGQVYVSSSQYGEYNKVTLSDGYLKNQAYTCQASGFAKPINGTFPMTIYMTNIYVNTEEYVAPKTEVAESDVLYVKNSEVNTTFGVIGTQTIASTKVDGLANDTSATYASNKITVPATLYDDLTSGEHIISVETATNIYTYNVTVVDVAISTAAEFEAWYGIDNYYTSYDDSQYVVLTANIDLSGKNYGWINSSTYGKERSKMDFNGTFDGQGYNIDNFTTYYGFMSLASTGTIKNVSFTNVYNSGVAYGGGFFAYHIFGTVSNVYYSGTYKTGAATGTSGMMYQCNTAVKLENFVVVLKANEAITTPEKGYGFACYAKINSSIYVVNEVMNPTAGSKVAPNGPASTDQATFAANNFFESYSSFVSTVNALPEGFSSDIWVYKSGVGLVFKSTITENDYFDTLLNYGKNSSTVADAAVDTTYNLGMTVYKKTGSNAATFYDNYSNLKTGGYVEWSFALMTTVDTSIIYTNAIKLKANTWYFFHVVVEDYVYNDTTYQVGQVYVSTSQYGTYTKQTLGGAYLTSGDSKYTACLNNLIHFVTGSDFDVYMTDIYATKQA